VGKTAHAAIRAGGSVCEQQARNDGSRFTLHDKSPESQFAGRYWTLQTTSAASQDLGFKQERGREANSDAAEK